MLLPLLPVTAFAFKRGMASQHQAVGLTVHNWHCWRKSCNMCPVDMLHILVSGGRKAAKLTAGTRKAYAAGADICINLYDCNGLTGVYVSCSTGSGMPVLGLAVQAEGRA